MKLFYAKGTCALAAHIVVKELGLDTEIVPVDFATKKVVADQSDYLTIAPKGQVPSLILDDSQLLTENAVILQYLADTNPASGLLPGTGSLDRYRVLEWVNFASTELHKGCFTPMFRPNTPEDYREIARTALGSKLKQLDAHLAGRTYPALERFTIADAYLFVMLFWAKFHKIDFGLYPNMSAYYDRLVAMPSIQQALTEEGLS